MITIRCARCKGKVFRYLKIGKGRLLHCWKGRIIKDYSLRNGNEVRCRCGSLIGIDEGKWIRMKQSSFIYSGAAKRS
ncbi:MAG: hypothetical protein J7K77_02760 [Dehalococcoidales bacterium]|nr:hypothetical protein [Dehalococcoidales bacterium]